jgi:signal transduction histidine kinase
VTIDARHTDAAIEVHVTDEGAGFAPDFVERAFERFSRDDAARTAGGSGLGLAIVDAVAVAHGGAVGLRNGEPGADVWLSLPVHDRNS